MRLLLLNYEFPPLGGGASSASFHTATELVRLGHEVDVLTSAAPGLASEEVVEGVRIHRVTSLRRGMHETGMLGAATYLLFAAHRLKTLIRERDFDCAHFFFALPTGALARYWTSWTGGRPYIVSLRGSDVPGYDGGWKLAAMHGALRPETRRVLSGATAVVANSTSLQSLAARSFPEISIDVITNGVCIRTFHPGDQEDPPVARRKMRLVCVARLVSRKGIEDLIAALAQPRLATCALTIVGEGPREAQLRKQARALGVADRVTFAGRLEGEALSRCYRAADCFVLPSLSESFSMALLEAMASGLPVVAARTGGIPELVENGVNGYLVQPGDSAALAAGLERLLRAPELMRQMGQANRAKICGGYTMADIVQAYEQRCYHPAIAAEEFAYSGIVGG